MKNLRNDFIAGSIAGVAVTVTGHPFDTIKVRMQSDELKKKFLGHVKSCWRNEGLSGFFKGMASPLATLPLINAVVLAVHEIAKRQLGFHDENHMTIAEGVLCGGLAGFSNCILVTPSELIKCRLQLEYRPDPSKHHAIHMLEKVWKEGKIKALYTGNVATVMREVPAYAAQFGGYYYAKKFFAKLENKKVEDLNNYELMLCGAIGGYCCWQFSYPQDVVKTLLQTQGNLFKHRFFDGGFYECSKFIYTRYGFSGFWKGYLPCTIRALLANAVLFLTYENIKALFKK